jgi:hypothetical protein
MNVDRLRTILQESTVVLDQEPAAPTPQNVIELIRPLPKEYARNLNFVTIDCFLWIIGVDKAKGGRRQPEFEALLQNYPSPKTLAAGPTYLEFGATTKMTHQEVLRVFALGAALGLWKIKVPSDLGYSDEMAIQIAEAGGIMISGYSPQKGKS